jgi:hypothetical protein
LEKEFLLKFSKEGQKLTFNIKDDKWLEKLMTFGEKTVFTNSNKILATFGDNSVMTPQFEYLREGQDLRAEVIKFLGTDFYPQIPSYGRNRDKITNQLVAKFVGTSDSVVGQTPKPELPDAVYDWFVSEVNRFLPVMPRTLQMKYMQELTNL